MLVIKNENTVGVDCDDTLLMWDNPTVDSPSKVPVEFADTIVYLTPHNYHVQLVKMYKMRGYHVIVWSANGWAHAEKVVKALNLDDYVDVVQTKLSKHMDDSTDPGSILGPRVYTNDFTKPIESDEDIVQTYGVFKNVTRTSGSQNS